MNTQMGTHFLRAHVEEHTRSGSALGAGAKVLGKLNVATMSGKQGHAQATQRIADAHKQLADMHAQVMGRPV